MSKTTATAIIFSPIIIVIIIFFAFNFDNISLKKETLNKKDDEQIISKEKFKEEYLKDHSKYFALSNIVSKYYSFLFNQDEEKIFNLLKSDYLEEHNITKENILEHIPYYEEDYSITLDEVYIVKEKEVMVYFLKSILIEELFNSELKPKQLGVYDKVYLNEENFTFSIEPINKEIYEKSKPY